MKRENRNRAVIGDMIMSAQDGISLWAISLKLVISYYAVVKHVSALRDEGLPIDKTFSSGPKVLWCHADRRDAVLARQCKERKELRAVQKRIAREKDKLRHLIRNPKAKRRVVSAPESRPLRPEIVQRTISAAAAKPIKTSAPRSVFEYVPL